MPVALGLEPVCTLGYWGGSGKPPHYRGNSTVTDLQVHRGSRGHHVSLSSWTVDRCRLITALLAELGCSGGGAVMTTRLRV